MGNQFRILHITHAKGFSHAIITNVNNAADIRHLHLEPFLDRYAKGLETDNNWIDVPNAPGYFLKGDVNFGTWKEGDIVTEQYYPEEYDNR